MSDATFGTAAADPQRGIDRRSALPFNAEALSPRDLARQVLGLQRSAWESGEPVTVEQLLASEPKIAEDPESAVDLIYHEYLLRERYAERPQLDEFTARFPEHAEALRIQIAFHRAVQESPPDPVLPPAVGDRRPHAGEDVAGGEAAEDERLAPAIGGYDVLDEIGFGGMGVVYRARQRETNRLVALKVLSAGAHAGAVQRARFRSEAELIARVQHPNIVQIHEASERQGCPFLVLEYIGGGNLRDRSQGMPHAPRSAARLVEVIARALAAAHAAGVIHRDLTPGNILFTAAADCTATAPGIDEGIPKLTDFGLAKSFGAEAAAGSSHRTIAGDIIGTPAYMSPEQAGGRNTEIGPATDIYSLGTILYELLTGRPPFRAVTAVETLQLVSATEPVPPSRLQPGVPADLETICLKCLQKQPAQRYPRAADLADDVRRYLAGEPILARPVGPLRKLTRWCRRKPQLAALVALVTVLVVVVVAGSMAAAVGLNQAARDRYAEAKLAEARVQRTDSQLGRAERSLEALAEVARIHATPEVRDEVIASLALFDLKFERAGPSVQALADIAPDLQRYVQLDDAGDLVVRRFADDAEICRVKPPRRLAGALFSPDGSHVVCRRLGEQVLEIWSVGSGEPRLVLSEPGDVLWGIGAVNFTADSRQVAFGRPDGLVRIYRLEDGAPTTVFQVSSKIRHLAFHPRLPQMAVATEANLQIRDVRDGRLLIQLEEAAGSEFLTWHPHGRLLVTSDRDGSLSLWEPDLLRRRHTLHGHAVGGVETAFNHSGTLLFSTAWDGSLRVWDPHWGKPMFATIGATAYRLRFSADDRYWAGDQVDGTIRVWELPKTRAYRRLTPEAAFDLGYCRMLAVSPVGIGRGRLLAVAMEQGVGFWDLRSGHPVGHLPIVRMKDLAFDTNGNLLTADADTVQFWPIRESMDAAGRLVVGPPEPLLGCPGTQSQMACSADGHVVGLSQGGAGGLIFGRDQPGGLVHLAPHEDVRSIAMTPDGKMAATGCHNGTFVRIWDASSGALLREFDMGSSRVAFSPDGRRLLTTANGLELWSVADWQRLWTGAGASLSAHAFSRDSRFVALDGGAGQILVYAADDGRVVARLADPYPAALHALAFDPEGTSLIGISRDLHQLFVWDLAGLAQSLTRFGIACDVTPRGDSAPAARSAVPTLTMEIRLGDPDRRLLDELAKCRIDLESQPQDGALLFRLGTLQAQLGCDREARDAFRGGIAGGASVLAPVELAACEIRLGNWTEGLAVLERALADPALSAAESARLYNHRAWYLNLAPPDLRNPRSALESAHLALALDPEERRYLHVLGLSLYRQGELPLAIETLRHSLRTSAMPVFDLYILALCHQAFGDQRCAADYLSRADYLFETQEETWIGQRRGELQQLREEYARALKSAEN